MSVTTTLPSFRVIAAALREVTERLARELFQPSAVPPQWTEFEWVVARAVCAMQGISGLLATRLRWTEPAEFRAFLQEQKNEVAAREAGLRTVLARLDDAARQVGIPFIALKGSALFSYRLHAAGERPMCDIDVLTAKPRKQTMSQVIADCGYELVAEKHRHDTFEPVVRRAPRGYKEHRDNPVIIELHTFIAEQLPCDEVDITTSLWPMAPHPGVNAYASVAALMRHLLLHAAGNIRAHALRLIQLYDIAALTQFMNAADWDELLDPRRGETWWIFPVLALTNRYAPGNVPSQVLRRSSAACPARLRAKATRYFLHEVSWSNLRIPAFPGYEWSRSIGEALRFARSRIFPEKQSLGELLIAVQLQPGLIQLPWYQLNHAQRVLRWIAGRPPRVQTMISVMAARAEGGAAGT